MKLAKIIEQEREDSFRGSPQGEQLKLLALKGLINGIGSLERAKKEFMTYYDSVKKRNDNIGSLGDFFDVAEGVDPEDVIMVVRQLDDLILLMRTSTTDIDDEFDEDELEKQVVYKKK